MEKSNHKKNKVERKYLNTWYEWWIIHISHLIKTVDALINKVATLCKNVREKKLNKPKWEKQSEQNVIKNRK